MDFIEDIYSQIQNIKMDKRQLRKFGSLMAIVLEVMGVYLYWQHDGYIAWVLGPIILFFLLGVIWPSCLSGIYKTWMSISIILGFFISRIILGALFYLLITPIGLIVRIIKGDPLNQRIDRNVDSYWLKRQDDQDNRNWEQLY